MSSLRVQLQITRINRTRQRTAEWWHRTHCPSCAARAAGDVSGPVTFEGSLGALLKRMGIHPGDDDEPTTHNAPKAH